MATEKIKAIRVEGMDLWEVNRRELELVVNNMERLQEAVAFYDAGKDVGIVLLTKEEMDTIAKIWRQKKQ